MGCSADAKRHELELLRAVPTGIGALGALVRRHESGGKPEEAEGLLRRMRLQSPRNLVVIQMLASFLERQGRPEEGEAVLREGLAIEPRSVEILNLLAYLNADRGVKLTEALTLADAALALAPSAPHIQDTMAWVLFRLGRLREAEQWARKSLETREDAEVREHLGDILDKEGRLEDALTAWRQALTSDNANDERREGLKAKLAEAEARGKPRS